MAVVETETRPFRFERAIAVVAATALVLAVAGGLFASRRYRAGWKIDVWARPVIVVHLLSVAVAIAAGAFLFLRRPRNLCGIVGVGVGVALGCLYIANDSLPQHGWWLAVQPIVVFSLRPLLFWLVLAYPIGRLDRTSRRVYFVYVAAAIITLTKFLLTAAPHYPVHVFRESTWTLLVESVWWDVGGLVALTTVLIVVQRRRLRFRGQSGAALLWAALIAAIAATGGDLALSASGPLRDLYTHGTIGLLTPFGTVVQVLDIARWGLVVAILAIAARPAWRAVPAESLPVEVNSGSLRDTLRQALGDDSADIAVVGGDGRWVDGAGAPRPAPVAGDGVTFVLDDGAVVAALEHDEALVAHPALIDAAVTALMLQLTARRRQAEAESREDELRALARAVMDAEDAARQSLERDLHDGAQQVLVGVTLEVALAARNNGSGADGTLIADAIDGARDELLRIASGRPPALLAERGLDGAIGALVMTAGIPVRVDADQCADIAPAVERAVWFTTAEAVANALKHSGASALDVSLRRVNGSIRLVVRDNGRGGVTSPPAALAARVDEAGGTLDIDSTSSGTVVRATFRERAH
jgi:signal transduction histidine kinase